MLFGIFAPRRLRYLGCGFLLVFQCLIFMTGNYTFFNLLAITLCVLLLDDAFLCCFLLESKTVQRGKTLFRSHTPIFKQLRIYLLAVVIFLLSLFHVSGLLMGRIQAPDMISTLIVFLRPFHLVNHYGLFTIMTTSRPEIIVEGSDDLNTWLEYEFKWKPGDLTRAPAFVAPHQPRLDWQFWFSAFSSYERDPWVVSFLVRLLEGSPAVISLLGKNPFPKTPPRYIRALLYDYRFTGLSAKAAEGRWWQRERIRPYTPVFNLSTSQ